MMIKAESYKIFSEIYCPIVPAPLELYFGDRCRSESEFLLFQLSQNVIHFCIYTFTNMVPHSKINDNEHNAFAVLPTMQTSGEKRVLLFDYLLLPF